MMQSPEHGEDCRQVARNSGSIKHAVFQVEQNLWVSSPILPLSSHESSLDRAFPQRDLLLSVVNLDLFKSHAATTAICSAAQKSSRGLLPKLVEIARD